MSAVTTFLQRRAQSPMLDVGQFGITARAALPSSGIVNGNFIQLVELSADCRLTAASLAVSGTLGAGATVQLRRNRGGVFQTITAATTAGAAGFVNMNIAPTDLLAGDIIEALVGGANVTAAATITADVTLQRL